MTIKPSLNQVKALVCIDLISSISNGSKFRCYYNDMVRVRKMNSLSRFYFYSQDHYSYFSTSLINMIMFSYVYWYNRCYTI